MLRRVDCKVCYLRLGYQNFGISSVLWFFCFYVSKRSGYRKFSRFDSEGSVDCVSIFLDTALVNVSTCLDNPGLFIWWIWFMIPRYCVNLFSRFSAQYCPAISNICNVTNLVDNKQYKSTAPTSLNWIFALSYSKKLGLGIFEPFFQSFNGLMREILVLGNLNNLWFTYLCILSLRKSEHELPPCPSKTPK